MNIRLSMLAEKLEVFHPDLHISDQDECITRIQYFHPELTDLEPNVLYLGQASALPELTPVNHQINILYFDDGQASLRGWDNPKVNLFILNNDIDMMLVFNELQKYMAEIQTWVTKLNDCLFHNRGLQSIIDVGYELIGNPIALLDASYKDIGHSQDTNFQDPIFTETNVKGYLPPDYFAKCKAKQYVEKFMKSLVPFIFEDEIQGRVKILANVTAKNKIIANMTVFEYDRPLRNSDLDLVAFLCDIISVSMQQNALNKTSKGMIHENFIVDLLDGKIRNSGVIEERVKFFEWNLKDDLYIVTFKFDLTKNQDTTIFNYRDYLDVMIGGSNLVVYNDDIIVMIINRNENKPMLGEHELNELNLFVEKNQIYAGVSRSFKHLSDTPKYFKQSLKAIELGLHIDKSYAFYAYEKYAIYDLWTRFSEDELLDFCHPFLFDLIEFDQQNNTFFASTLYTYISNNNDIIKSAKLLNIHRNTMRYRISRIKEIMDVDFEDGRFLLHLYLSFKILKYLDKLNDFPDIRD